MVVCSWWMLGNAGWWWWWCVCEGGGGGGWGASIDSLHPTTDHLHLTRWLPITTDLRQAAGRAPFSNSTCTATSRQGEMRRIARQGRKMGGQGYRSKPGCIYYTTLQLPPPTRPPTTHLDAAVNPVHVMSDVGEHGCREGGKQHGMQRQRMHPCRQPFTRQRWRARMNAAGAPRGKRRG